MFAAATHLSSWAFTGSHSAHPSHFLSSMPETWSCAGVPDGTPPCSPSSPQPLLLTKHALEERGEGGEGGWSPKVCVPKMAQINVSVHFTFSHYEIWGGGGSRGGGCHGTPCHTQHSPSTPTTGLRERRNNTSRGTSRSGRQKVATRRNMRREERVTVRAPVKEQQPDGVSHGGCPPSSCGCQPFKYIPPL